MIDLIVGAIVLVIVAVAIGLWIGLMAVRVVKGQYENLEADLQAMREQRDSYQHIADSAVKAYMADEGCNVEACFKYAEQARRDEADCPECKGCVHETVNHYEHPCDQCSGLHGAVNHYVKGEEKADDL